MSTMANAPQATSEEKLLAAYEAGKHRRYGLLFAVNGGAFAVAELLGEKGGAVGGLTTDRLALGMIVFTAVMAFDIGAFGLKMRRRWWESLSPKPSYSCWGGLFALPGWAVLGLLTALVITGWVLVTQDGPARAAKGGVPMQGDVAELVKLNEDITALENAGQMKASDPGKADGLDAFVAEKLAFRRLKGFTDREGFLGSPRPGNRVIKVESVHVWANRAVVACVVTDGDQVTHNVRLFVRVDGKWKLLGWANEPA